MGEHKKQHFVPQSYLRRFSKDQKQIQVYDKVLNRSFSNGIRDVAQESNFYTIPNELIAQNANLSEVDRLMVEKALQKYEQELNRLIATIIDLPQNTEIPHNIREGLSTLIAIQQLRTKNHRKLIEEATEKFNDAILQAFIKENFGEEALKYKPKIKVPEKQSQFFQSQQLFDFDNLAEMAHVFINHIWMIGINNTNKPFYTSDSPIVMHTPLKNRFRGVGIKSFGIEIAYPLSSNCILTLVDRKFYANYESFDGKSANLESENVEFYNSLQVLQCDRQVFCEENDFSLVEDMVKSNPNLSHPNRNRIAINKFDG